jgi:predicted MFS family arabinose efflux permease
VPASLAAAVVLIVSFVLIELRSSHPLLPMRLLADRNRSGAYLIMLCIGTAMFGLFFFLTLFTQTVLGYSAVRSGIAYLPFTVGIVAAAGLASRLVARVGPRPLILAGTAAAAGGMFWFSRLTEHAGYGGQLLGPILVTSSGLGLLFVPLSLVALHNVADQHAGVAASLLNAGQQVGGAIGLAALGTIAWTAVAGNLRNASAAVAAGRQPALSPAQLVAHALATGFAHGFLVAAGIALLALAVALATIRLRRQDLAGVQPAPQEDTARQPATMRQHDDRAALAAAVRPCRYC